LVGKVRWGILGAGTIARVFASALPHSQTGELVAIGTRDAAKPDFARDFAGATIHSGYDALLADPTVDAVYLATPHPGHLPWGLRTVAAGKHLLCEKPICVNVFEAMALVDAARRAGVFLMEAFMYRCHPQTRRIVELIAEGAIGETRLIQASRGSASRQPATHRLFAPELAGGAILDVGCYPVSMVRLIAGAAAGRPFLDPVTVSGAGRIGNTGVDEWAAATLAFDTGVVAQVSTSVTLAQENVVRVFGTTGRLEIPSPWVPAGRAGGTSTVAIVRGGDATESMEIDDATPLYVHEIDTAGAAIAAGRAEAEPPAMTWADSIGNMRALDAWRAAIGLEYPLEQPAQRTRPFHGGKLTAPATPMPRARLPGVARQPSAIALGTAGIENISHAAVLLDPYFERGGDFIDTAYAYGNGRADTILGHWLHSRGVRDDVFILGKGAHSPLCYPDVIPRQIGESLERLQTGRFDAWLMHRDNTDIPVGEFVDALDAEVAAGRTLAYGMSNWSLERLREAIDYARSTGRTAPTLLSNNFSLAEMVEPVWRGCIASSSEEWRQWLRQSGIALVAWSSQARGFFTDRAGRDVAGDSELVRCWYSEANFARRDRATELGRERGFTANQVALAHCLHQDFPVVPIVGPLTPEELDDSLGALKIDLTPADLAWLELGMRPAA
jgi:predicted dehydrogenase/aryl-alcohol dehydrogenase-like predicted oxidoreductase